MYNQQYDRHYVRARRNERENKADSTETRNDNDNNMKTVCNIIRFRFSSATVGFYDIIMLTFYYYHDRWTAAVAGEVIAHPRKNENGKTIMNEEKKKKNEIK